MKLVVQFSKHYIFGFRSVFLLVFTRNENIQNWNELKCVDSLLHGVSPPHFQPHPWNVISVSHNFIGLWILQISSRKSDIIIFANAKFQALHRCTDISKCTWNEFTDHRTECLYLISLEFEHFMECLKRIQNEFHPILWALDQLFSPSASPFLSFSFHKQFTQFNLFPE